MIALIIFLIIVIAVVSALRKGSANNPAISKILGLSGMFPR